EVLAASVIDDSLVEGATDPLGDTTADLPLDDHRIHHGPAVVLDHIAEYGDIARGDVDLDDGRVAAAGERGLRRGVVPEGLEPRLLALGQDGARPRLDQAERDLGGDLGERRCVPLALRREAARDQDLAARLHPDVRALVRTDAGPLDVAADAKAEVAPARPGVGLPGPEVPVADHVEGHLEPRR